MLGTAGVERIGNLSDLLWCHAAAIIRDDDSEFVRFRLYIYGNLYQGCAGTGGIFCYVKDV